MKYIYTCILLSIITFPSIGHAQITEAFDDFEGNNNIPSYVGDNCDIDTSYGNIYIEGSNLSPTVLKYEDTGGQFANVRFQMNDNFDLSTNRTFSIQIYIPSNGITGNQTNQVSLKLQDGSLPEPWTTQSEIIKPVILDEWQTVTFDFEKDIYINLDPNSIPPIQRTDFNRVLIQVNGEDNADHVLAYIDDIMLFESQNNDPIFDELVWSDEFEIDGAVDSVKWFHQTQIPQGNSWFNGEVQHYTDRLENTFIENGVLKVLAKKENYTDQGVTKEYTSARLNSKFAFTYGKVEIRAKLPTGIGTWPAMWMLGKNITEVGAYWQTQGYGTTGWPACGEIDIMEHWGANQDYVSSALHTPSSFGATINQGGRTIQNASTEFHLYTMTWTEEKITFSIDGVIHYVYNPTIKNDNTWPFYLDQYILFNVAILPSIESNFVESPLEVDYIRIYQESDTTDVVLPVELLSFAAKQQNQQIILNWATALEINSDYFSIEKLINNNWREIGQIESVGNSYEENTYTFIDAKPINGLNYYRLNQFDSNGSVQHSNVKSVLFEMPDLKSIRIYPNPSSGSFTFNNSTARNTDNLIINIYNSNGQNILKKSFLGDKTIIDLSDSFQSIYYYIITENDERISSGTLIKK